MYGHLTYGHYIHVFNIQQKRHNTVQHTENAIWHIAGRNSCVESWAIFIVLYKA